MGCIVTTPQLAYRMEVATFFLCCKTGNLFGVKEMLENCPTLLMARDNDKCTPLHEAARHDQVAVIRLLLWAGADLEARDRWQHTPLHEAAGSGCEGAARHLAWRGADLGARTADRDTPLHRAAHGGDPATVRLLLGVGAELEARAGDARTPLHVAAANGHAGAARQLLGARADPDALDEEREAPLHLAVRFGDEEIVELLLRAGADLQLRNGAGRTPLQLAGGKPEVERRLAGAQTSRLAEREKEKNPLVCFLNVLWLESFADTIHEIFGITEPADFSLCTEEDWALLSELMSNIQVRKLREAALEHAGTAPDISQQMELPDFLATLRLRSFTRDVKNMLGVSQAGDFLLASSQDWDALGQIMKRIQVEKIKKAAAQLTRSGKEGTAPLCGRSSISPDLLLFKFLLGLHLSEFTGKISQVLGVSEAGDFYHAEPEDWDTLHQFMTSIQVEKLRRAAAALPCSCSSYLSNVSTDSTLTELLLKLGLAEYTGRIHQACGVSQAGDLQLADEDDWGKLGRFMKRLQVDKLQCAVARLRKLSPGRRSTEIEEEEDRAPKEVYRALPRHRPHGAHDQRSAPIDHKRQKPPGGESNDDGQCSGRDYHTPHTLSTYTEHSLECAEEYTDGQGSSLPKRQNWPKVKQNGHGNNDDDGNYCFAPFDQN